MFKSVFDELFSIDWNEVKNELEKNYNEFNKNLDEYTKDGDYHSISEEWKDGKLVKKDEVEYKDGKLVKDNHIDNSKKLEAKEKNDCECTCKCHEKENDEISKLRGEITDLNVELDKAYERNNELVKENETLKKKLEEIKNLF